MLSKNSQLTNVKNVEKISQTKVAWRHTWCIIVIWDLFLAQYATKISKQSEISPITIHELSHSAVGGNNLTALHVKQHLPKTLAYTFTQKVWTRWKSKSALTRIPYKIWFCQSPTQESWTSVSSFAERKTFSSMMRLMNSFSNRYVRPSCCLVYYV